MNAPDPTQEFYLNDFVAGQSNGRTVQGRIARVPEPGNSIYLVQLFSRFGPTAEVVEVMEDDIYLHPTGRMSVVERISQSREKVR